MQVIVEIDEAEIKSAIELYLKSLDYKSVSKVELTYHQGDSRDPRERSYFKAKATVE